MLKDAASAAIYGARAANGVVIIKTRRGRNTGSLKFTYDGYVAQQEAQDMPQRVDIRTELNMVNWVYINSGQAPKYTAGYIDSTESGIDPIKYPNTNWLGLIYKTAPMSDQTVRLSGGNDLATLSLSANYFDQEGILNAENYYKRATLRGNTNFNISKRLTAQANLMLMHEKTARPRGEGDAQFRAIHDTPPTSLATYPDGAYSWSRTSQYNPLALLREQGWVKDRWITTSINTLAAYAMENGLKFGAQFEADNKDNRKLEFQPTYTLLRPVRESPTVAQDEERPHAIDRLAEQRTSTWTRSSRASTSAPSARTLFHLLTGYEQRQSDVRWLQAQPVGRVQQRTPAPRQRRRDVPVHGQRRERDAPRPAVRAPQLRLEQQVSARVRPQPRRLVAVRPEQEVRHVPVGVARLARVGRAVLPEPPRLRQRPQASRLVGPARQRPHRRLPVPADHQHQFGQLRLQQQSRRAAPRRVVSRTRTSAGKPPSRRTAAWTSSCSSKLSFTGDVYNKLTSGILLAVPISTLVGQTAPTQNAASVQNAGWEAAVNWRSDIGSFNYTFGFNIANNKNRITSSRRRSDQRESPSSVARRADRRDLRHRGGRDLPDAGRGRGLGGAERQDRRRVTSSTRIRTATTRSTRSIAWSSATGSRTTRSARTCRRSGGTSTRACCSRVSASRTSSSTAR